MMFVMIVIYGVSAGGQPIIGYNFGAKNFGSQNNFSAPAVFFKRLAHNPFAFAGIIHIRGVEKIYASIEGAVDDGNGVIFIGGAAKIHGAQTQ